MPTASVENYLKTIYHLQQASGGAVRTKEIAEGLALSPPSVTSMLKVLAGEGLLDYAPYQGVRLTERGAQAALRTIRKHRLIELFLMRTVGFTWDEVHREAEALEHAVSDRLADRIEAYLGYPEADPHGDPIPRADGSLRPAQGIALSDLPAGTASAVVRVLDQAPEVLRYLGEHGLAPGAVFTVVRAEPLEGPLTLDIGGHTATLSSSLAHRILVKPPGST